MLRKLSVLVFMFCVCGNRLTKAIELDNFPRARSLARPFRPRLPEYEQRSHKNVFVESEGNPSYLSGRETNKVPERESLGNDKQVRSAPLVLVNETSRKLSNVPRRNKDHMVSETYLPEANPLSVSSNYRSSNSNIHNVDHINAEKEIHPNRGSYFINDAANQTARTRMLISSIPRMPLPEPSPSHDPDNELVKGVLPPDVCDRCPVSPNGDSLLEPCTCAGNTGTGAGLISITCPNTMLTVEQLKEILTNPDYYTTHVSRFTMQDSNVTGIISQSIWGKLDFNQVLLDNNKLDYVDNKAFANSAQTMHYLSLRNNRIKQYVTGQDNELPYLETLLLSGNEIPIIFSGAFTYRGLKVLDLANNLITSVGEYSFADLDNIVELNLSHNMLTSLEDYDFKFNNHVPPSQLIQIILANNNISYIANKAFADLYYVQIDLQNNQLTTLSEEAFKHILTASGYYAYIMVSGNPIVCDCDILWMVEDSAIKACFDNFVCANNGLHIGVITPDQLGNCTRSATHS